MALIEQLEGAWSFLSAPAPATNPTTSTAQTLIAVAGVLVGLLVGLGVPWLNATLTRRAGRGREQHAVADQILQLWQRPEEIRDLLTHNAYGTRRSLLLLGSRLRDEKARNACLMLVHYSSQDGYSGEKMIDDWSDLVLAVSKVYRNTGS